MKTLSFPPIAALIGVMVASGCAAPRHHAHVPRPKGAALLPLKVYWNGHDFYTTARGGDEVVTNGYRLVQVEGYVFSTAQAGTVPLKQYWNEERHDHYLVGNSGAERFAVEHGYQLVRTEGYIYQKPQPGTASLRLFWSEREKDNAAFAAPNTLKAAISTGYEFHRIEGYLIPVTEQKTNQPPVAKPAPSDEVPRQL